MTQPTPEIPDSVSSDLLNSLLDKRYSLPPSDKIPVLNFGGYSGGPSDLQLVIGQLIEKSANGVNVTQMLVAALHLMHEVRLHLKQQLQDLHDGNETYAGIDKSMRRRAYSALRRDLMDLTEGLAHTNNAVAAFMEACMTVRADDISAQFAGGKVDLPTFRSYLLISEELLSDLGIERSVVTDFLHFCTNELTNT